MNRINFPQVNPGASVAYTRMRARAGKGPSKPSARVQVSIEQVVIPTYLPAPSDKNPMFLEKRVYQGSSGKVYPLPFTDRIAEKPVDRKWKAVWIENEFIRAMVLPEIGGRVHMFHDKSKRYDPLSNQPVSKPAPAGAAHGPMQRRAEI